MKLRASVAVVGLTILATGAFAQTGGSEPGEEAPPEGQDPSTQEAVRHFKAAREHYKDGRFVEALAEFQKAYDLKPTAAITYNIARCYEQLGQWKEAIEIYQRFLKESDDARERSNVTDKIEFLKTKLSPDEAGADARYKARLEAGKQAYSRGDYERAIEEFKAAFDIKASASVLFNIAKSYERMGRYEDAIEFYTQYLDLDPNASDRADVEETIRRLQKSIRERFQELSVSSDPPGADIYLDDRNTGLQGQTNFRFKVTPGPHTIYLDLNGYKPVKRDFVMPDDKPLALEFQLEKLENVGYAQINVNVEGARLFIDGAIIGLSPYKDKKALTAGAHQLTVEAIGYPRYTTSFEIVRDQTTVVNADLAKWVPGIKDETLSGWGSGLLIGGIVAGGLGFGGAFGYQKIFTGRPYFNQLGPDRPVFGPRSTDSRFWKGQPKNPDGTERPPTGDDFDDSFRKNGKKRTLEQIQLWSLVGGGILAGAGLGFYMWKWFRPEETRVLVTSDASEVFEHEAPLFEITGIGAAPTDEGAAVGISARF